MNVSVHLLTLWFVNNNIFRFDNMCTEYLLSKSFAWVFYLAKFEHILWGNLKILMVLNSKWKKQIVLLSADMHITMYVSFAGFCLVYAFNRFYLCLQVTSEGFLNLAEGCVNLQHLTLNDLITLDDLCIQVSTIH